MPDEDLPALQIIILGGDSVCGAKGIIWTVTHFSCNPEAYCTCWGLGVMKLRGGFALGGCGHPHPMRVEAAREDVRHVAFGRNLDGGVGFPRAMSEEINLDLEADRFLRVVAEM